MFNKYYNINESVMKMINVINMINDNNKKTLLKVCMTTNIKRYN